MPVKFNSHKTDDPLFTTHSTHFTHRPTFSFAMLYLAQELTVCQQDALMSCRRRLLSDVPVAVKYLGCRSW